MFSKEDRQPNLSLQVTLGCYVSGGRGWRVWVWGGEGDASSLLQVNKPINFSFETIIFKSENGPVLLIMWKNN